MRLLYLRRQVMYRVNYRQRIGEYKGQRMFYNGSFLSKASYSKGDIIVRDEVCGEVEVLQTMPLGGGR